MDINELYDNSEKVEELILPFSVKIDKISKSGLISKVKKYDGKNWKNF